MTDNNMTWVESGWVKRNSQSPSPEIVSIVFALPKTDKGAPTYSSQSINDRLTVVFRLSEVKTSDIEPNIGLGRVVLGFESDEVFKSILESIKSNTEVKIFSERL
jgi:hypothetical protein